MAPHPSAIGIHRQLGGLRPRSAMGTSNQDKLNPAHSASPAVVLAQHSRDIAVGVDSLRSVVHRTPLPLQEPVAG